MGFLINILLTLGTLIFLGVMIFIAFRNKGYNHKVIVWRKIAGAKTPIIDIGMLYKDTKDGSYLFKTKKTKIKCRAPPDASIHISPKGRFVELELTADGNVNWISSDEKIAIVDTDPLTTTDKQFMANQYYKALQKQGKSVWDMIQNLAVPIMFLVIFIVLLVFYDSLAEPALAMGDKVLSCQIQQTQKLELLKEINQNIQVIGGDDLISNNETKASLTG